MNKKIISKILMSVSFFMSLNLITCAPEMSDYERGKADGKAACDCLNKAETGSQEYFDCLDKIDSSFDRNSEYGAGVSEASKAGGCNDIYNLL